MTGHQSLCLLSPLDTVGVQKYLGGISCMNALVSPANIMQLTDPSTNSRCKLLRSRHLDVLYNKIKLSMHALSGQNRKGERAVILGVKRCLKSI